MKYLTAKIKPCCSMLTVLASHPQLDEPAPPESVQASLLYIRRTLDAAGRLSSISGSGMVGVGSLALVAVWVNMQVTGAPWQTHSMSALAVWVALLAAGFGGLHIIFGAYIFWRHDG